MKRILALIKAYIRRNKNEVEHLYYLDNIERIKPNEYVINECMITK